MTRPCNELDLGSPACFDIADHHSQGIDYTTACSALRLAEQIQWRAARLGFDWDQIEGVLAKVEEELAECRAVLSDETQKGRLHELGDLLFACVNLARHLGVDPEQALAEANRRFERRFAEVERRLQAQGLTPGPETRDLMEQYWREAKAAERP